MRDNPHNKTYNRPVFTGKKADIFLSLFHKECLKQLAYYKYVKGYTLEQCAEEMNYSKRYIERLNVELKNVAIVKLVDLFAESETESEAKLCQIRNILNSEGGEDSAKEKE